MRIAIVHSFYRREFPSGENTVVVEQVEALREAGHDVGLFATSTDEMRDQYGRGYSALVAVQTATGYGLSPSDELDEFSPDIVHVHNLFPNWGDRWLKKWSGRCVATMHNFRTLCAAGNLLREGNLCTLCPDGKPWSAVQFGCYHNSRLSTLPLALGNASGPRRTYAARQASALVFLSPRSREVFASYDIGRGKSYVVPNFVSPVPQPIHLDRTQGWAYVGRLSRDKGVLEMVTSWPADDKYKLTIYGDGDLREDLGAAIGQKNITLRGAVPNAEIRTRLSGHTGMVFPSQWPEGLPTVYLEALEAGLPVLTTDSNSVADDLAINKAGAIIDRSFGSRELIEGLERIVKDRVNMSANARQAFAECYTKQAWVSRMMEVYESVLASSS